MYNFSIHGVCCKVDCLGHLEAAGQLGAEGQTRALTGREADGGGEQIQDREDDRRNHRDGDDLLNIGDLLRDDGHRNGDGETLQEVLDGTGDQLRTRKHVHCIFRRAKFFRGGGAAMRFKAPTALKPEKTNIWKQLEMAEDRKEVYLEADKEVPGQHYACVSFVSPNKVLADKRHYFFTEFLKDYGVQYKIKATETFVMSEVNKVQNSLSAVQDVLDNLVLKGADLRVEDLSGALSSVKAARAGMTADIATDLETHVKANMSEYRTDVITEAYDTFLFKNKKKLEDAFFEKNEFRTTVQGLKIRGVFDTYGEAMARAKTLQKLDPSHNIYIAQVGHWVPWDPEPHEIGDMEYADDQLNTLMKKYKENEEKRDEFFAEQKAGKIMGAKAAAAAAVPRGVTAGSGAPGAGTETTEAAPTDMFGGGEDLFTRRKREAAASGGASNTISHA